MATLYKRDSLNGFQVATCCPPVCLERTLLGLAPSNRAVFMLCELHGFFASTSWQKNAEVPPCFPSFVKQILQGTAFKQWQKPPKDKTNRQHIYSCGEFLAEASHIMRMVTIFCFWTAGAFAHTTKHLQVDQKNISGFIFETIPFKAHGFLLTLRIFFPFSSAQSVQHCRLDRWMFSLGTGSQPNFHFQFLHFERWEKIKSN